jgi:hypothetical protein
MVHLNADQKNQVVSLDKAPGRWEKFTSWIGRGVKSLPDLARRTVDFAKNNAGAFQYIATTINPNLGSMASKALKFVEKTGAT